MHKKVEPFLNNITRPARYIDNEVNTVKKAPQSVELLFGLAFPDVYEVGMSHLGLQIIYHVLNSEPHIACERVFAPWDDMEAFLRKEGLPLTTLENGIPLNRLHVLGFSIQYELCYTNILNMLELGGITLFAEQRREDEPFVIAGGPGAFNPEPVAPFFDLFLLGDGERAVVEICNTIVEGRRRGLKRKEILESLTSIEGVYVPAFFDVEYNAEGTVKNIRPLLSGYRVKRRIEPDIEALPFPTSPVVPYMQTVHDRLTVEIARGCTRGCRFCQAGMIYRPVRERSPERIVELVREGLKNTGFEEVSLLSLSTGDYTAIEELLTYLMRILEEKRVALSLPSLRVGTVDKSLADEIRRVRKTGFTLAPEAGTERLRRVINKLIEDEDLLEWTDHIFSLGWRSVKLYFMIGLPTESIEDVEAIIELAARVATGGRKILGRNPQVNVSVGTFVPKPFTPFQWEPQLSAEESKRRLEHLRRLARKRRLEFKWHHPEMSHLEGVFSRGDRRLSGVVLRAYRLGCRFDGWTERLNIEAWKKAFDEEGLSMDFYTTRRRPPEELLPWDHLDCGLTKDFLLEDYRRALELATTPDCKTERCTLCGVCDHKRIKNVVCRQARLPLRRTKPTPAATSPLRVRVRFSKTSQLKYLSHLELTRVFARAIRRAALPVRYSAGFHPMPKIAFLNPLPVGIASLDEYMDMELEAAYLSEEEIRERLNRVLPEGIRVDSVKFISLQLPSLSVMMKAQEFLISLEDSPLGLNIDKEKVKKDIEIFLAKDEIPVEVTKGEKKKVVDLKPFIERLCVDQRGNISLILKETQQRRIRPQDVLRALFGLPPEKASLIPILKVKTLFQ